MHFTAFGGADEIGASCSLIEIMGYHILVDCGIRPNAIGPATLPDLERLPHLDLAFVTHAHLDHTGALPLLRQRYPRLPILVTPGTHALLKILLVDAVKVMDYNCEICRPLYGREEVQALIESLTVQSPEQWFFPLADVVACFAPAGHILGAAMVLLDTPEGKLVFSGDVSLSHQRTVRGARVPDFAADVLVLESTYGARQHEQRAVEERELARIVGEVVVSGGVALVPSFAIGRAQEVILTLRAMQRTSAIPNFPIYIDGMVRAVCGAYRHRWQDMSPEMQSLVDSGIHPFKDAWVHSVNPRWRDDIPRPGEPCCIVSSSGMLTGGPSVGYAQRILDKSQNAILFPGYTDEESPGRKLQALKRGDQMVLEGQRLDVNAQVHKVNLSAHADGPQLVKLVEHFRPRSVILVHGEADSRPALAQILRERCQVYLPKLNERLEALPLPRWLGSDVASSRYTPQRYNGQMRYDPQHIILELDRGVMGEPAWRKHYASRDEIIVGFVGERLVIEPGRVKLPVQMEKQLLMPVEKEKVEVLVEQPKTEDELLSEKWYASMFPCIACGANKRYRINLISRQVEWLCPECSAHYEDMIMRLRDKDLKKLEQNDKLRMVQFIHVSLRLHEPVLPDNWPEVVTQRFWERWMEPFLPAAIDDQPPG